MFECCHCFMMRHFICSSIQIIQFDSNQSHRQSSFFFLLFFDYNDDHNHRHHHDIGRHHHHSVLFIIIVIQKKKPKKILCFTPFKHVHTHTKDERTTKKCMKIIATKLG